MTEIQFSRKLQELEYLMQLTKSEEAFTKTLGVKH